MQKGNPEDYEAKRAALKQLIENRNKVRQAKFEIERAHYNKVLEDMINLTLSVIDKDTTQEQIKDIVKIGNKEWLAICARVRQTNKVIKLNINAYLVNILPMINNKVIIDQNEKIIEKLKQEE